MIGNSSFLVCRASLFLFLFACGAPHQLFVDSFFIFNFYFMFFNCLFAHVQQQQEGRRHNRKAKEGKKVNFIIFYFAVDSLSLSHTLPLPACAAFSLFLFPIFFVFCMLYEIDARKSHSISRDFIFIYLLLLLLLGEQKTGEADVGSQYTYVYVCVRWHVCQEPWLMNVDYMYICM